MEIRLPEWRTFFAGQKGSGPILFDLQKKCAIPVDESPFLDSWSVQFKHWSKDSRSAHILFNKRGHQELALLSIDSSTGKVTDLVRESPDTFVDYSQLGIIHKGIRRFPHKVGHFSG